MLPFDPLLLLGFGSGVLGGLGTAMAYDALHDSRLLPTDYVLGKYLGREPTEFEFTGVFLYLVLGGVAGAAFPYLFETVLGLERAFVTELPYTLVTALAFAVVAMALIVVLIVTKIVEFPERTSVSWPRQLAPLLVYGLVLAVMTGLTRVLWHPIFGPYL